MDSGIDTVHVERHGWAGDCEFVARPRGLVVLARDLSLPDTAASERQMCDVLHGYRLSTLQFEVIGHAAGPGADNAVALQYVARGVEDALDWLRDRADTDNGGSGSSGRVGLFGIGVGGAAVLRCVALQPGRAAAVVSRNGRPDLVAAQLPQVQAATLLIVGRHDADLLPAHRMAMRALSCSKRLEIVPGAVALHQDPAALDAAAHLAGIWFVHHLERVTLQ